MIRWNKYWLDPYRTGRAQFPIDREPVEHARTAGEFRADESYASKEAFFKNYLFGCQRCRLEYYDHFIRGSLRKDHKTLSLGSGRCANELYLIEDGYDILCSDLERFPLYARTKELFPRFEQIILNILSGPAPRKYDAILCLSLIYLFGNADLETFFRNVSESLETGGHLILDSAGSPDHPLSYLLHDVWLKYEVEARRVMHRIVYGKRQGIVCKHHGFRRTDQEIVSAAARFGLNLVRQKNYSFLNEFMRSEILSRMCRSHPAVERRLDLLGRRIPYVRMYDFEKT